MPWFKVDDRLAFHPKVMKAGNEAIGLWVRAGSWAAAHLTDGEIPSEMLPILGGNRIQAGRLVRAGLWVEFDGGYKFHDWTVYQPSAEDAKAAEDAEKRGGSWGNHVRWHVKKKVKNANCRYCNGEERP